MTLDSFSEHEKDFQQNLDIESADKVFNKDLSEAKDLFQQKYFGDHDEEQIKRDYYDDSTLETVESNFVQHLNHDQILDEDSLLRSEEEIVAGRLDSSEFNDDSKLFLKRNSESHDEFDTRSEASSSHSNLINSHRRKHKRISAPSPPLLDRKRKISVISSASSQKSSSPESDSEHEVCLSQLFKSARYFMIKSNNQDNIAIAKQMNVWSTPPNNEPRLNKAFATTRNVILIYSVKESGRFAGFARLASESRRDVAKPPWVLPKGMSINALGGVFSIDWICRHELDFQSTMHLYNAWNDNKPVKIGRDGQEIDPTTGEALCRIFAVDFSIDLVTIVDTMQRQRRRKRHVSSTNSDDRRPPPPPRRSYTREHIERRRSQSKRSERARYRSRDRSSSRNPFAGVRQETIMHGSYQDYMREYQNGIMNRNWPAGFSYTNFYNMLNNSYSMNASRQMKFDNKSHALAVNRFLERTASRPIRRSSSRDRRRYRSPSYDRRYSRSRSRSYHRR